ncbi:MAG: single-stranded DNA-binding protein [Acidobacteria bacterium]|nr:single-stranded DNA-binding protein [Acidobacteriota bacterium]
MGINKVILVGNVGRDVDFRALPNGNNLAKFTLATSEARFKDSDGKPHTEWHRIVVWGKLAEICNQYVTKGKQLYVEGRIRTSSYEKDGIKRYSTEIYADTIEFLGRRSDSGTQVSGGSSSYPNDTDTDDVPF